MTLVRQFIIFATDNESLADCPDLPSNADARQAGIERSLRFIQALVSLLATYPLLSITSINVPPTTSFLQLRANINVTRRLLRFFRFLEQFKLGWDFYCSNILDFETWLDVVGKTCLGIFGMLESVTLLDLLKIDQLEIFGSEQTVILNYQAQLFWFIALCLSLTRSSLKLLRILGHQDAPKPSSNHDAGEKISQKEREDKKSEGMSSTGNDTKPSPSKSAESSGDQAEALHSAAQSKAAISALILKLVSDIMDLLLPATAIGLIQVDSAVIAVAMIISTAITARDIWARCGKQMRHL